MKYCMITFRSVTPAQRAEGLLRRKGISCGLQRTPRWMQQQGCGYSLRLRHSDAADAAASLREAQIPFRKIYLQSQDTVIEELEL